MWIHIKSALVSGVITAFLAVAGYVVEVGDVYSLDSHKLVNVGVLSLIVAVVSVLKSYGTNYEGKFLGAIKIK